MAIRCINRITASKLYMASSRKKKILAAMSDPINLELVQQLDEYIGDEYKPMLKPTEPDVTEVEPTEPESTPDTGRPSPIRSVPSGSGGGKLSERFGDDLDAEGEAKFDATNPDDDWDDDSTSGTADEATPNSSTKPKAKKKIVAETTSVNPCAGVHASIEQLAGELKGTLNARSSTAGVIRAAVKDDELWLYYNDSINLNNVMPTVIDLLNAAGYNYLLFNRLARTDNAMVFTLALNDTATIVGDEDET